MQQPTRASAAGEREGKVKAVGRGRQFSRGSKS